MSKGQLGVAERGLDGGRTVQAVVATPLQKHGQAGLCQQVAAVIAAGSVHSHAHIDLQIRSLSGRRTCKTVCFQKPVVGSMSCLPGSVVIRLLRSWMYVDIESAAASMLERTDGSLWTHA